MSGTITTGFRQQAGSGTLQHYSPVHRAMQTTYFLNHGNQRAKAKHTRCTSSVNTRSTSTKAYTHCYIIQNLVLLLYSATVLF